MLYVRRIFLCQVTRCGSAINVQSLFISVSMCAFWAISEDDWIRKYCWWYFMVWFIVYCVWWDIQSPLFSPKNKKKTLKMNNTRKFKANRCQNKQKSYAFRQSLEVFVVRLNLLFCLRRCVNDLCNVNSNKHAQPSITQHCI